MRVFSVDLREVQRKIVAREQAKVAKWKPSDHSPKYKFRGQNSRVWIAADDLALVCESNEEGNGLHPL